MLADLCQIFAVKACGRRTSSGSHLGLICRLESGWKGLGVLHGGLAIAFLSSNKLGHVLVGEGDVGGRGMRLTD